MTLAPFALQVRRVTGHVARARAPAASESRAHISTNCAGAGGCGFASRKAQSGKSVRSRFPDALFRTGISHDSRSLAPPLKSRLPG